MALEFEYKRRHTEPRYVRDVERKHMIRMARVLARVLWELRKSLEDIRTDPDGVFAEVLNKIREIIEKDNIDSILVISPFIYRRYAERFAKFIEGLRKRYNIEVTVITRSPEFIDRGREEHAESIDILRRAGIAVCTVNWSRFHAKAIVLGYRYVIAGSMNPLAPSHEELVIVVPLIKLIENPVSAKSINEIFRKMSCRVT